MLKASIYRTVHNSWVVVCVISDRMGNDKAVLGEWVVVTGTWSQSFVTNFEFWVIFLKYLRVTL